MEKIKVSFNKIVSLFALCLLLAASCAAQSAISVRPLTTRVDEYIDALVKQNRFSGAVLLARDGHVLLSKGYGMANFEMDVPNTPQTKFRLGSVTKQFTAMAVLILQERGKLSVQDSVCKYVENCPPAWQPVTIHNLLTHTSGIPNFTGFPEYGKLKMFPSSPSEIIALFKDKPLEFAPGERFNYSNSGYVLLGYIVERASGKPYADFMRENIFQPLGMKNTDYDVTSAVIKNRATGYSRGPQGIVNAPYVDMTIPFAAGGLYSTVEDLYLWDRAFYTEKLVSKKSLEAMHTPFKEEYGYGVGIGELFGLKNVRHGGGIEGFSTFLARFPENNAVVIVLSNMDSSNTPVVAKRLSAMLFSDRAKMDEVIKVSGEILKQYEGRYQMADNAPTEDIAVEGDHLNVMVSGSLDAVKLLPVAKDEFVMEDDFEVHFIFNRDAKGRVESYQFKTPRFERVLKRVTLPPPSLQGNTTFRLSGHADAKIVNLAGSFNDWKPSTIMCGKDGADWVCRIDLQPGKYFYKFIVDGNWIIDPANPNKENDGHGNVNSVIEKR
jgi:CubicO group peptidase (beta-lactamase class C family)